MIWIEDGLLRRQCALKERPGASVILGLREDRRQVRQTLSDTMISKAGRALSHRHSLLEVAQVVGVVAR